MPSSSKMKIVDNTELRNEIEENAAQISHVDLANWSINIAKNVLPYL